MVPVYYRILLLMGWKLPFSFSFIFDFFDNISNFLWMSYSYIIESSFWDYCFPCIVYFVTFQCFFEVFAFADEPIKFLICEFFENIIHESDAYDIVVELFEVVLGVDVVVAFDDFFGL